MLDLGSAVGYLLLDTKDFQTNIKKAQSGFKSFFDKSNSFGDKMKGLSSGLTTVGTSMTKSLTLPILGAGAAMVTVAGQFDSALSQLQSATGATSEDMKGFEKVLDSIYQNNYGESYEDIANSIAQVSNNLGDISNDELQKVTESALTLRDVFGVDVSESVRATQSLMKNFGLSSEQAFDMITEGFQNGLDFSGEFLDTINEYSPQFTKLGLDAEDMFRIMQNGADSGAWNLDKIGDAMKELSIRVIDGSKTTAEGFDIIGLNADEMANKFALGGESAKEALLETVDALANMEDPLQQNLAGVNLFGTMWEDLGPEVVLQMANIRDASYETAGAMDELKAAKYDNLKSDIESLGRSFGTIAKDLGMVLIPYIRDFVEWIQDITSKFTEMDKGTQEVILAILGIVAAIGPVLTIAGKVAGLISTISGLIGGAGGLSAILGALTGPIGLVIAAVVGLFVAWQTNFAGIRDYAQEIFNSIGEIIDAALNFIKGLWENNFLGIQDIVSTAFENISLIFETAFEIISGIFEVFSQLFQGNWEGAWNAVKETFSNVWNNIFEILGNVLNIIVDTLIRIGVRLWEAAKQSFENVKKGFEEVWNSIMEWITFVIEDPVAAIESIGESLFQAGSYIFNMLWDGLKSVWESITKWVNDAVDWIVSKVKFWQDESAKVNSGSARTQSGYFHSAGLDYVPYNGYRAILHEGEAVLTKQENEERNKTNGGDVFNFYSPKPIDEATAAREFKRVKKEIAEDILK